MTCSDKHEEMGNLSTLYQMAMIRNLVTCRFLCAEHESCVNSANLLIGNAMPKMKEFTVNNSSEKANIDEHKSRSCLKETQE